MNYTWCVNLIIFNVKSRIRLNLLHLFEDISYANQIKKTLLSRGSKCQSIVLVRRVQNAKKNQQLGQNFYCDLPF